MKAFKLSYLILILFGSLLYFEGFLTYYLSVYIKNNYFLALIMLLIALLILFLYKFLSKGTIRKNFSFKNANLVLVVVGLVFPLALIGRLLNPEFDLIYGTLNNLKSFLLLLSFSALTLLVVIKEEIIQRLLLQEKISDILGSLAAVLIVPINFSLYHFGFYIQFGIKTAIIAVISILITSILIALLFEKTKSILLAALTHFLINFIILFQIFLSLNNYYLELILWFLWGILFIYGLFKINGLFRINLMLYDINLFKFLFIMVFSLLPFLLPLLVSFLYS